MHFIPGHSGPDQGPGNETGIAASVHLEVARHLFVTAAADHYRIPWLRYRSSSPSYGSRMELRGNTSPVTIFHSGCHILLHHVNMMLPPRTGTALSVTHTRNSYHLPSSVTRPKVFISPQGPPPTFISPSEEKGYLLCQDFSFTFRNVPLRLWFRYALCSSGGWDSRLYAWENDLLSSFSVPAFYGEMTRTFIMLSWKPADRVEARLKYALTDSELTG